MRRALCRIPRSYVGTRPALLRLVLFLSCVSKFSGNELLARRDGGENRLIKKALHQPNKYKKIDHLRTDSKPINEHKLLSCGLSDDVVPERVRENENHRNHEAVNG